MRQSVNLKQSSQAKYGDQHKPNKRTFSQKDANALNQRSNRNTLFIGGANVAYNAQSRQNTQESAESSKSRNGGLNDQQFVISNNYHVL